MEHKKTGLTIIELLIVLGIISVLVGLLVPSLTVVRKKAREAKQKAQFATIELALAAFKNDDGDYPPSANNIGDYCGSQKLTEALLGWDLLGFHPKSAWRADGFDLGGGPGTYDPAQTRDVNGDGIPDTFDERKGPYLELATTNAFRLGYSAPNLRDGLFADPSPLAPNTFVLCDVFGRKRIDVINQVSGETTRYKAGTPILYFKANTASKYLGDPEVGSIYRVGDNRELLSLGSVEEKPQDIRQHPFYDPPQFSNFLRDIMDPKVTTANRMWPYRPDSYLLISAGADGLYGTPDDITNFGQ